MKTIPFYLLTGVLIFCVACNNPTSNSQAEDTNTDMPEKLFKESTNPNLSELTPLTMEELEAWLPS